MSHGDNRLKCSFPLISLSMCCTFALCRPEGLLGVVYAGPLFGARSRIPPSLHCLSAGAVCASWAIAPFSPPTSPLSISPGRNESAGSKHNVDAPPPLPVYHGRHIDKQSASLWCSVGALYSAMGQLREALEAYKRAVCLNPRLAEVWFGPRCPP